MKLAQLSCSVCYSMFDLFDSATLNVFFLEHQMITSESLAQGFAWHRGHVEFYTVRGDDFEQAEFYDMFRIDLEIMLDEPVKLDSSAVRAIQVPFSVASSDGIRISDDGDNVGRPPRKINIPMQDNYALVFEQGWKYNPQPIERNEVTGEIELEIRYTLWGRLWFNQQNHAAEPKILLHDPRDTNLRPTYPLCMNGVPG